MTFAGDLEKTRMAMKKHYLAIYERMGIHWCGRCANTVTFWALDEIHHRHWSGSPLPGRVAPTNHQLICWPCNSSKEDANDQRDYRPPTFRRRLAEFERLILSHLPEKCETQKYSATHIHEAVLIAIKEHRVLIHEGKWLA